MLKLFVLVQNFLALPLRSERGATAVEYGLLVALIAAVIVGIVIVVGRQVSDAFNSVLLKPGGACAVCGPGP
jgi:pilus assembly protein Flp/PilA